MTVTRPYRRIVRPFTNGQYAEGGRWMYILHPKYATDPAHFIRPFLMIQRELQSLFDFIEPSETNLETYSFKIHQLLMTTCMEIEANFKAIFLDNGCDLGKDGNIAIYKQLENSHRLSAYEVKLPLWREEEKIFKPFENWSIDKNEILTWYQSYNKLKHNRHQNFPQATLENLLNAVSGLAVLLTAQFRDKTFLSGPAFITASSGDSDGFDLCIGDYFKIRYPGNWPTDERYDFNWQQLRLEDDPFQNYPYQRPEQRRRQK